MILTSGQYAPDLFDRLRELTAVHRLEDGAPETASDFDLLLTRGSLKVTADVMDRHPGLRLIVKAGSGVDTIDCDAARDREIEVVATGGSHESVAEMALTLLMGCLRNINAFDRAVRAGDWQIKQRFVGDTVASRQIGVVGFGRIGRCFAGKAAVLGATVRYWDRSPDQPEKLDCARRIGATATSSLEELIARSDVLSLHLPATATTSGLFSSREFAQMNAGTIFVNTARAQVDERDALIHALTAGNLAAAGLDVHYKEGTANDDPLFGLDNVIVTPHVGAQTHHAHQSIANRIYEIIEQHVRQERAAE